MRHISLVIAISLLGHASVANAQQSTTIKKKNAQIVDGVIDGVILLKGPLQEQKNDDGGKLFTVRYSLVNGKDTTLIDEEGIHFSTKEHGHVTVGHKSPPNDEEVIHYILGSIAAGQKMILPKYLPSGAFAFAGVWPAKDGKLTDSRLLGHLYIENGIMAFDPALHILVGKQTLRILVSEVADFKDLPGTKQQ